MTVETNFQEYVDGISWDSSLTAEYRVETYLFEASTKWPNKVAIDFYDRLITYRELYRLSCRVAQGLKEQEIQPGSHIGLHLQNTPHYPVIFFGILMAGCFAVNLSILAAERETAEQIRIADVSVVLSTDSEPFLSKIRAISSSMGGAVQIVVCCLSDFLVTTEKTGERSVRIANPGELTFNQLTDNSGSMIGDSARRPVSEIAVLQFTGGTTGTPKAAILTHANLTAVVDQISQWSEKYSDEGSEKRLAVLPFFHVFGLQTTLLFPVARGYEVVVHLRFDPGAVLRDIERKHITAFAGVPAMYSALVSHPQFSSANLRSLRQAYSGGAALSEDVRDRFSVATGLEILDGYGLSETTSLATTQVLAKTPVREAVGLPWPRTKIQIVSLDDQRTVLPQGEIGEICLSGPQVMKGYWKDPEATSAAMRDGVFFTGDVGYLNPQGFLMLVARKKEILFCGGFNVYPRIVEQCIEQHPDVLAVAVIGHPDKLRGDVVVAFVVLRNGACALTLSSLRSFLRDKLATYELPTKLFLLESLPRTPVGKPDKKELAVLLSKLF